MKRKKHSLLLKLAVLGVVLYAAVMLVRLQMQTEEQSTIKQQTQLEIERQKRENAILEEMLEKSGTDEFAAEVARDSLGYVSTDEKIFVDISN